MNAAETAYKIFGIIESNLPWDERMTQFSELHHDMMKGKGFWDQERSLDQIQALIISELAEALEAQRNDRHFSFAEITQFAADVFDQRRPLDVDWFKRAYEAEAKGTFLDELADVALRIMDLMGYTGEKASLLFPTPPASRVPFSPFMNEMIRHILSWDHKAWGPAAETLWMLDRYCHHKNLDYQSAMFLKMIYNSTRPPKHGKQF